MTDRHITIALKWLSGEMSNREAAKAFRISDSRNVYSKVAVIMREAYRRGLIKV